MPTTFHPGAIWPDDQGMHINAHGGGVLWHEGLYYWFGEHKIAGEAGNAAQVGVHVYASANLADWRDAGIALQVSDDPASDITRGCVLERPKVVRCPQTGRFVMCFHLELKDSNYRSARSGVAVADRPEGPYTYLRSRRPNAGHWPLNVRPAQQDPVSIAAAHAAGETLTNGSDSRTSRLNVLGRDMAGGQHARDMTIFQDDDGKAYHVYASEHNSTLHIAELTDDYLDHTGRFVRVFEDRWMEAPALCKRQGRYYFLGSGCTGWKPNAARAAVADSIWGPWRETGNPCVGVNPQNGLGPELTFGGQSTFILPVHGQPDTWIAMFDLWRPSDAIDGRYLWLPITFTDAGLRITWRDQWEL